MLGKNEHIQKYLEFYVLRAKKIPKIHSGEKALFELHMDYPTHIAYGEIALNLKNKGFKLVGYKPVQDLNYKGLLSLFLQRYLRIDKGLNWPFHIFRGLGINSFVIPITKVWRSPFASRAWESAKFKTKDEVLNFTISEVLIGDLFYDWHMNKRRLGTVEIESKNFKRDFIKFLKTFDFWESYFRKNKIQTVLVSHTCYGQGLLTRIAIKYGVQSLQITGDRMYRMSQNQLHADSEYEFYDSKEAKLFEYQISLERSRAHIAKLKLGNMEVDASHSQVSGYIGRNNINVVEKSSRQKILIVAHCFSDSPNGFGAQLFPDYFEWLLEVLKASENINADWYIRPHPGFVHNDKKIFNNLISRYPNVRNVGLDNSIPALIKQGINSVLTSHGTVGFEAAIEGAFVVGASQHAFYKNYNFVLIPKSRTEWRKTIASLSTPKHNSFDTNEVYHYYDIHHVRSETSWLLREHYAEFLEEVGGLRKQFTNTQVFTTWLKLASSENDLETNQKLLRNFLESENYFFKYGSKM